MAQDIEGYRNDPRLKKYPPAIRALYKAYAGGALGRDLRFCLSPAEFEELIVGECWYCGNPPLSKSRAILRKVYREERLHYNGIDRVDNTEPYTPANCVSCCKLCNFMKRDMSLLAFLRRIDKISQHDRAKKMQYLKDAGVNWNGR